MAASQIPFPGKLDLKGDLATNWKKFKRVWENYEIAAGLNEKGKKLRTATFLTCIGPDALEIFDGFHFEDETHKEDIAKVIERFNDFCIGKTNETYERFKFNSRSQESGETIDAYVSTLRCLAKTCNYGGLEESLIRDRVVIGIVDKSTRKKLLQDAKLTLQSCIDICRANEKTAAQMKTINNEEVQIVRKRNESSKRETSRQGIQKPAADENKKYIDCMFCGLNHVLQKEECPAWGKMCGVCGKKNHFARKCLLKNKSKRGQITKEKVRYMDVEQDSEDEDYVLTLDTYDYVSSVDQYSKKIHARMSINGKEIVFQLDSGSTVNVLPEHLYKELFQDEDLRDLNGRKQTLVMFNRTETETLGKRKATIRNPKNGSMNRIEFVVVSGQVMPILGSLTCQEMGLISVNKENILALCDSKATDDIMPETTEKLHRPLRSASPAASAGDPQQSSPALLDAKLFETYSDVFSGEGKFEGTLHLELDKHVSPVKLPTRKVPIAVKPKLEKELQRLEKSGIIAKVEFPTEWISAMVVVIKANGKVRLCIDPKPLNKALKRNHYPIPTIEDVLPDMRKARIFTLADAKNGFWHVQLDEESSFLTTFATPWGKYRWKRMPFGISPAPEEFQRRLDEALQGLDGVKAIHDDILIFGVGDSDEEALRDHDKKLYALFDRCRERHIKLNQEKLQLRRKEVAFMGHTVSAEGLKVDHKKVEAIKQMPVPTDKKGVQRLLGMVNFCQKFAPGLSAITKPLRELVKDDSDNKFLWDSEVHGEAMKQVGAVLSSAPVLKYFDTEKHTVLQCDASEMGLGACLLQEGHPIAYASRALTPTETNYAQIEKELLAVVFGMEKFESYVYGRKVTVESDHKPLEIICKKSVLSAPKRLQRMLLKLQKFDYDIVYKKGQHMYISDTLSRAYLACTEAMKAGGEVFYTDVRSFTEKETESVDMLGYIPISEARVQEIREKTEQDPELRRLKNVILTGWPETQRDLPQSLEVYFNVRDELCLQDGILLKGERMIVPHGLRPSIVERVHASHIGVQGCLRRARECVYWPNMNRDIEEFVGKCEFCNAYQPEQAREPLISHEIPSRPWEKIGCDLFEFNNKNYLMTVDYYSNFFEVDRLHKKTGREVISKLKANMARHGIPDHVLTDNGPPFGGKEFDEFAKAYEFKHSTSSPRYPQSNGKVENAIKTVKKLMTKSLHAGTDPYLALLDWRNTPTEGIQFSPVQRLFGRRTKTLLPTTSRLLSPCTVPRGILTSRMRACKNKQAQYYNRGTKELTPLSEGETVRVRTKPEEKKWHKAQVEKQVGIRSYEIRTEDGGVYRRNRRHLRCSQEMPISNQPEPPSACQESIQSDDNNVIQPPEANVQTGDIDNADSVMSPKTSTILPEPRTSGRSRKTPDYLKDYVRY